MTTPAQGNFSGSSSKQAEGGFEASGLSAEEAERLASAFKPSWELDDAPFAQGNGGLGASQIEELAARDVEAEPRSNGESRLVAAHAPPQRVETHEPEVSVIIDRSITAADMAAEAQRGAHPQAVSSHPPPPPAPVASPFAAPAFAPPPAFAPSAFTAPATAPQTRQRIAPVMRSTRNPDESMELPASLKKSNKGLFIGLGVAVLAAAAVLVGHGLMSSSDDASSTSSAATAAPAATHAAAETHAAIPPIPPPPPAATIPPPPPPVAVAPTPAPAVAAATPAAQRTVTPRPRSRSLARPPPRCTTRRREIPRSRRVGVSCATSRSDRGARGKAANAPMKTRPLAVALLLASLVPTAALPPRVAFAQAPDEATTKMARARFQEGVAFFDKGQFEMARAAFLQAYALRKHPAVLLNLAQSSLKSGHTLEAARYFQQFLKEYSNATEAQRNDANKGLAEARTKLGHIDIVGATVGADVFVDDERIGMAPLDHSVDVEPGTHTVKSGDQSQQVTAAAGQGATARFGGAPAGVPVPAPAAEAPAEPAPQAPAEAAPAPVTPPPAPAQAEEPSGQSHHWGWVIATGAVTVVGFGFAGIMAAEKSSAQNSANLVAQTILANGGGEGTCYTSATVQPSQYYAGACAALASDNNNVNADATAANVGLIVGGIGAAGLIVSIIVAATSYGGDAKSASSDHHLIVAPIAGRGVGGMTLGGSF